MIRETFDYPGYLSAKKYIDDVSINRDVWQAMSTWVKSRQNDASPLRILEIGAGIGTMLERMLEAGLFTDCHYTAIELEAGFRDTAFTRLADWSDTHNYMMKEVTKDKRILISNENRIELDWVVADILRLNGVLNKSYYDLLVGHAIIDLLPVPICMPELLAYLKPGGAFYFSLNFSGKTLFLPAHPNDPVISEAYHQDMDKRFPGLRWQPSQTGLGLGPWLTGKGQGLLAEGASDWTLPVESLKHETNFLFISNILDTIENALKGMPELNEWLQARRSLLNTGELRLRITNQDLFGTISRPPI